MPRKISVVLVVVLSSLTLLIAGCGGGVSTTPPQNTGFQNSSLNGTYVYSISGTNGGGFFAIVGSFTANGNGSITGGMEDINSPGTLASPLLNVPITGSYAVRSDGRTVANISTTGLNPNLTFTMDFVLLNSTKGLAIRFDGNGTASGSVDMQTSQTLSSLAGTMAFSVSGVDSTGAQNPEGSAGAVTFDGSGNITGGTLDDNDNGAVNSVTINAAATAISSPVNGRGTATITTSGSLVVTRNFVYYVIDANHLKLIESDVSPILAGDAFRGSGAAISGSFAFTLAGATGNGTGVFATGGIMNTDGAGNVQNSSVVDVDDGGSTTALTTGATLSGTYTLASGRGTMALNATLEPLNLVFYPSTGGLLLLDVSGTQVASGTAVPQTGGPFSNSSISGTYGLNLTGVTGLNTVSPNEIDAVAQFSTNNGSLNGALDFNNFGLTSTSLTLTGTYSVSANGRATGTLHSSLGTFNVVFYTASTSKILFIENDNVQVSAGVLVTQ